MTILSDSSIQELCLPPEKIYDADKYQQLVEIQNSKGWPLFEPAIEKLCQELKQLATRTPTAEDLAQFQPMIFPFVPNQLREAITFVDQGPNGGDTNTYFSQHGKRKIISRGTTSYGYDVSLTEDVKLFTNLNSAVIDPKRFDQQGCLVDARICIDTDGAKYVILPPNSYLLGRTEEYFHIPRDIMVVCVGKSTYARCGAIVNTTPIEPGFHGNVVIEVSNSTPSPLKVYLNEGIAQFLFFRGDRPCITSYGDRGGKYQGQVGVVMARV